MRWRALAGSVCVLCLSAIPEIAAQEHARLDADANVDRAWLAPTAITNRTGTLTVRNRELFVLGLSYSVTDRVQVELDTLVYPVSAGSVVVKVQLLRQARWHVTTTAAQVVMDQQYTNSYLSLVGGIASYCFGPSCAGVVSAGLQLGYYEVTGSSDDGGGVSAIPSILSVSVVYPIGKHRKVIAEVNATRTRYTGGSGDRDTVMPFVGARVHTRDFAVDAGIAFSVDRSAYHGWRVDEGTIEGVGIPWMSASVMWP